jgi:hypothetical protein
LLAHSITNSYSIEAAQSADADDKSLRYNEVYYDVLKSCTGDLALARSPLTNLLVPDPGGDESPAALIAGVNAVKGLFDAISSAVDGIAKMIENRRIDRAIRDYIKTLEPLPEYAPMSASVVKQKQAVIAGNEKTRLDNEALIRDYADDPSNRPELGAIKKNAVRASIKDIKEDLKRITATQRQLAARQYYVQFMLYKDLYDTIAPGKDLIITNGNGGERIIKIGKETVLKRGGQTSSERYAAVKAFLEEKGLEPQQEAVLKAAEAYDLAYAASGVNDTVAVLDKAWTGLVKYAYEPKKFDLGAAVGLLNKIKTTVDEIETAFNNFDKAMKEIKEKEKKKKDGGTDKEEGEGKEKAQ